MFWWWGGWNPSAGLQGSGGAGNPLLGINLGTLGYLAEIDRQNIFPALDKLVLDEYVVERRMMLEGKAMRMGKHLMQDLALNDIVIGRRGV